MQESTGALGLTNIVIVFLLLFTGYLCIMLNNNKAYKVKAEVVDIIEKHNGFDDDAREEISNYMASVVYRSTGTCDEETDGIGYTATGEVANTNNSALYCIKTINLSGNDYNDELPDMAYYKVKVFFSLDLPIIRSAFDFSITGNTKKIFYPNR